MVLGSGSETLKSSRPDQHSRQNSKESSGGLELLRAVSGTSLHRTRTRSVGRHVWPRLEMTEFTKPRALPSLTGDDPSRAQSFTFSAEPTFGSSLGAFSARFSALERGRPARAGVHCRCS